MQFIVIRKYPERETWTLQRNANKLCSGSNISCDVRFFCWYILCFDECFIPIFCYIYVIKLFFPLWNICATEHEHILSQKLLDKLFALFKNSANGNLMSTNSNENKITGGGNDDAITKYRWFELHSPKMRNVLVK